MKNTTKRGRAAAKEIGGKAEKRVGKLVGSERMEVRGRARELAGKAEKEAAKTRARVSGKVEELKGKAERKVVAPLAQKLLRLHGSARSARGRLRQKLNEPSDADDAPDEKPGDR
jgi:uncharacterized protein YjbJ (UPF0337 family)